MRYGIIGDLPINDLVESGIKVMRIQQKQGDMVIVPPFCIHQVVNKVIK